MVQKPHDLHCPKCYDVFSDGMALTIGLTLIQRYKAVDSAV